MRELRILHLAATDSGGLGRSALRLHQGLLSAGHDSSLLVKTRVSQEKGVSEIKTRLPREDEETAFSIEMFQRWYIDHNRTALSNSMFTLGEPGLPVDEHPLAQDADLIHLHAVTRFLSPGSLARLAALGKPIVWTLHDMRPFTGGCHFSAGCAKFTKDCNGCPQLGWDPYFITEAQLGDMLEVIPAHKITCVAPTEWLAAKARASALFRNNRVDVIPYGIEADLFPPRWKPQAKSHLGLDPGTLHLLFVANRLGELRKGFDHLARAIQHCLASPRFKAKADRGEIALISLGHPHPSLATLGIPYVCLGYLESDEEMGQLYAAADLFLLPSLEENSPNTLMEAMSCGTPPVAFNVGGIPELVTDNETGRLVPARDEQAFAHAIEELLFDEARRELLGQKCRAAIQERFAQHRQAENYARLYRDLLKGTRPTAGPPDFERGNDLTLKKLAPIGARLRQICTDSLPKPLQGLLEEMEKQAISDRKDIHQMRDFLEVQQKSIEDLQTELDRQRGALRKQETTILQQNQLLQSKPIKMLRQLKLIKK